MQPQNINIGAQSFCKVQKAIMVFAMTLLFITEISAQDKINTIGLKIGERVPDITIDNIINYKNAAGKPVTTAKISDFKSKLLIIDFWATWCSPCIAMIPKMDSLQKQFAGKVQFLPVSYQSKEVVISFLDKFQNQKNTKYNLPDVTGDTELEKLFPHTYLPHYVIISQDGIVKAITEDKDINEKSIRAILNNEVLTLQEKKDDVINIDRSKPLFLSAGELRASNVYVHSVLTGYLAGAGNGSYRNIHIRDTNNYKRITARNLGLKKLFQLSVSDDKDFTNNKTIVEVKSPELLTSNTHGMEYENWLKEGHGYCYELMLSSDREQAGYQIMQNDLQRYFPQYRASVELKNMRCWSLERINFKNNLLESKGGDPSASFDQFGAKLKNCYLRVFMSRLGFYFQNMHPLYDNTGYKGFTDLEIKGNLSSIEDLNRELSRYGLKFIEADRNIEVLVIKDATK